MSNDPIERVAEEKLFELSADLQVQLEKGTGVRPVLWMLAQARNRAAKAIVQMSIAEPDDIASIRICQAAIRLYDDMVQSCRDLMKRGKEADRKIAERDREEMQELIMDLTPEEQRMTGLEPTGTDL